MDAPVWSTSWRRWHRERWRQPARGQRGTSRRTCDACVDAVVRPATSSCRPFPLQWWPAWHNVTWWRYMMTGMTYTARIDSARCSVSSSSSGTESFTGVESFDCAIITCQQTYAAPSHSGNSAWLHLLFDFNSISNFDSTAIRPHDDLRFDRAAALRPK